MKLDKDMIIRSIDATKKDIAELVKKRDKALMTDERAGTHVARMVETLIDKREEELRGLEYALKNMT